MLVFKSRSASQTRALAKKIGSMLKGGEILALTGTLGSGKTTFVKGLTQSLGIKNKVTSPTFVIFNVYPVPGKTRKHFYHFDLYRLRKSRDLIDLGFSEIIADHKNIVAIEWPEKAGSKLTKRAVRIKFTHDPKNSQNRIITIA